MSLKRLEGRLRKKNTRIPLETKDRKDLVKDYRLSRKMTFAELKRDMQKRGVFFPQPIRTQPSLDVFYAHPEWSVSKKIAKQTASDVKEWGPKIFADIKYDGVRGLLYINPKKREVELYSRRLKELKKLEKKYADAILDNVSDIIKDETVVDTEIYAVGSDGKLLEYGVVAGWARNPYGKKYDDIIPSIEAFDVVLLNGKDIRDLPLFYRKKLLETVVKRNDGKVLDIADTRFMKNHPRPIEWRFKAIIKGKGEGLVVKDPESEYFYGKPKGKSNPWRKLKAADTLDLEMKAVEVSPRPGPFEDYRHWITVPNDDDDHEVRVNKGIKSANLDNDFYRAFSLDMINQWKRGKLQGSDKMVPVRTDLVDFYGVERVPDRLIFPKTNRMIVQIFLEKISGNLYPSGTKAVGIREDKVIGDEMKDLRKMRDFFLAIKEK
jgi:ATP-dependent DNA ligase